MARNAPERRPGHRAGGAKEGDGTAEMGAKCFERAGCGGGTGYFALHCRAAAIGACLDAVVPLFTRASEVEIPVASTSRRR